MREESAKKIKFRLGQICDAFSALEFAHRNYNSKKDASDIISIVSVAKNSGMYAFEILENEINALLAEVSEK